MVNKNSVDLTKIQLLSIKDISEAELIQEFNVADYQRGYRWGEQEVNNLLEDIISFKHDMYCLQPLVLDPIIDYAGSFELIDGQQRITTIFLILCIFKNKYNKIKNLPYKISYNTRDTSKLFLNEIAHNVIFIDTTIKEGIEPLVGIKNNWKEYIVSQPAKDNIDNFHFFQAYSIVDNWLTPLKVEDLFKKLWEKTYVIWYPVKKVNNGQSVQQIFLNLNSGKISLTSAELIKALFILNIDKGLESFDLKQFKRNELANEWDQIEKSLHNDAFWYFVSSKTNIEYQTRIGILFDIKWKKPADQNVNYSYYQYSNNPTELDWTEIKSIFSKIEEWFDDTYLYHRIGFIVNVNLERLEDIVQQSEKKSKSEFKEYLNAVISVHTRKVLESEGLCSLDNLNYLVNKSHCQFILLLYNILSIEKIFPGQRFPFDFYQRKEWSIEHIHPQNPKSLDNAGNAIDWLSDYLERFEENIDFKNKALALKSKLQSLANTEKISKEIAAELQEFVELVKDEIGLHQIGNLALLDKKTNSKIGNKKFVVKRNKILEVIQGKGEETYIPLCTINNFLKSTTRKDHVQMTFWSDHDSESYKSDIMKVLSPYLPEVTA